MIDERLKTRDESGSTSSPTKRHPEHREGSIKHLSSLSLSMGLLLISLLILAACTDYVQKMDDDFNEWEEAQQQAELSSSSQVVMSSSSIKSSKSSSSVILSGDSREESSSSTKKNVSSSSNKNTSSSSTKLSSSNKASSSSGQKINSSSSVKTISSSSKATSSSSTKSSSSSAKAVSSSSNKKNEVSSSSVNPKISSSGKASWAYLNPAISYGEIIDDRDGQVYKTVKIGEQTWMAENLNFETGGTSFCIDDDVQKCDTNGRVYTCNALNNICPEEWHLPSKAEFDSLISFVGGKESAGAMLKSKTGWHKDGNGSNSVGFSAFPTDANATVNNQNGMYAYFWISDRPCRWHTSQTPFSLSYRSDAAGYAETSGEIWDKCKYSVRCIKNEKSKSSSNISSSSSSKASWAYLNPAISYGEIVDDRDGQVYKTVVIDSKTWMAENLNYESVKSYCYENKKDSCSKYGHLYIWSAAMDSIGAFSTNSKGCGYPNECHNTKNPVRGVCPEKWHIPSQQEWYDLSTYNSSTIREDLSSAGERLKSANGWFNSGDGDNTYGFSVLPAGVGTEENYSSSGKKTCFWSSSDANGVDANGIHFDYGNSKGVLQGTIKYAGCSIRCVKD